MLFIFLNLLYFFFKNKKNIISKDILILGSYLFLFLLIGTMSFLLNINNSDSRQYIKMILNFTFLINIVFYIKINSCIFIKKRKTFQYLFEFIIFLSFFQIILNIYIIDFWKMPFIGIKNSVEAYKIVEPNVFFGTTEKNIWATKIAFIEIIYFTLVCFKYFKINRFMVYVIWFVSLFNILYTFSRTAQLVFMLFLIMFFILKIFNLYKNFMFKFLYIVIFILFTIPITAVIFDKLFHLTLDGGDGMSARIELWILFYNDLKNMNIFIGNGILYAKHVIPEFTRWTNNNFHNVFLNIFSDEGLFGLILYILILKTIFFKFSKKIRNNDKNYIILVLFLPFFACINSHYLGYDNDIVIYFSLVYLTITYLEHSGKIYEKNINNHSYL